MKYFDAKMGALGALLYGSMVYYVNRNHPVDESLIAASKQAAYTFLAGGVMTQFCRNIASSKLPAFPAVLASSIVPGLATTCLTYLVHSLKGTPEPFNSAMPTLIGAPIGFAIIGGLVRRKKDRELEKKLEEGERK